MSGARARPNEAERGRIVEIDLDAGHIRRWSREIEHERQAAVFDLLERNRFALTDGPNGPYRLHMAQRESNLVMTITPNREGPEESLPGEAAMVRVVLALRPLRKLIKDYFLVCEAYLEAIRGAPPSRIEAIDMGRRALHDDGAHILMEALATRVILDHDTARRLFTLICVLNLRG